MADQEQKSYLRKHFSAKCERSPGQTAKLPPELKSQASKKKDDDMGRIDL